MDKLVVKGGARLKGRVEISGSKNSALPILAATLLTPETCVIHNVPDLSDIRFMLEILRQLGAKVTFENGTVTTRAEKVITEVPYDLVRKMRASIWSANSSPKARAGPAGSLSSSATVRRRKRKRFA